MGNAIKYYERTKRKERKETLREVQRLVHDTIMKEISIPREIKKAESEVYRTILGNKEDK